MMKLVVICSVLAAAAANVPLYFTPAAIPSPLPVGYAVPLQQALYNYRGPLSLSPGQPANIVAADGRPLDTLDVNLDRSAHFIAKALDNAPRVLKKRSVTRLAVAPGLVGFSQAVASGNIGISTPIAVNPIASSVAANIATSPIGLTTPFTAQPFSITRPFAAGPIGVSAPVTTGSLAVSTPITTASVVAPAAVAASPIGISVAGTPFVRTF